MTNTPTGTGMYSHAQGLGRRSEEILMILRREITEGLHPAGGKLPTEMALCERFGVTRPTVRRAVARLAAEGLIQVRQGAGMSVAPGTGPAAARRTMSIMFPCESQGLAEVQRGALARGYLLSVYAQSPAHWDVKAERAFLELVLKERHAGLLAFCSPLAPRNDELLRRLTGSGVRVVHIEHFCEPLPMEEYLLPDYRKAGHMAAVALLLAGYRRLAFFGLNQEAPYPRLMAAGFAEALDEQGFRYDRTTQHFQYPRGIDSSPAARDQVRAFISSLGAGAGIVCESAGIAATVADLLRGWKLRVPDDFGVIGTELIGGFRDSTFAPADALVFPRAAMLERALARITDPDSLPLRDLQAPRLVRRGTVRSPASV